MKYTFDNLFSWKYYIMYQEVPISVSFWWRDVISLVTFQRVKIQRATSGHIAHLRKPFKLINTMVQSYDYMITLIWREENLSSLFWKLNGPNYLKPPVLFTQGCFVPSFVEIGPVFLEKKIFKVRRCIFAIL